MQRSLKFLFVLTLLIPVLSQAQDRNEEVISWSDSRKLTWSDYKANPNPESDAAASTTTVLSIQYKISTDKFSYTIQSSFSKSKSWGRHKSDYILSHEQGHFDLAEIFARKLHRKMSEYKFNRKTYQKDLNKIYQEVVDAKEEMQNEYDEETNHSINKEKQAKWLEKIEKMLEETADYADY
jgi:predicted secreted Zn-dependent protease